MSERYGNVEKSSTETIIARVYSPLMIPFLSDQSLGAPPQVLLKAVSDYLLQISQQAHHF